MKIKKFNLGLITCVAAMSILVSCYGSNYSRTSKKTVNDCSGIFETRTANNAKISREKENSQEQVASECKVLEVKIDNSTKCQIVGSDRIDNLKEALNENKNNKIILIAPEKHFQDAAKSASKYLMSNGIDVKKYFASDVFNEISFPYKGMKCVLDNKRFVVWFGDKKVILTLELK